MPPNSYFANKMARKTGTIVMKTKTTKVVKKAKKARPSGKPKISTGPATFKEHTQQMPLSIKNNAIRKLKYVVQGTLPPAAAGGLSAKAFYLTRLDQPDPTGVGHQPLGYDQLALLYNHYQVIRAKATVHYSQPAIADPYITSSGSRGVYYGMSIEDTGATPVAFSNRMENAWSICELTTGNSQPVKLSYDVDTKKYLGNKTLDSVRGLFSGGAPADNVYVILWMQALNSGFTTTPTDFTIMLEYTVICNEPVTLISS